jgi:tetratricopeptide (TPR) repeat protein/transglutaminase-like putative cysteine protease
MKITRRPLAAAALLALLAAGAAQGTGPEPGLDAKARKLADRIAKDPGSHGAVLDVIELERLWDLVTPGLVESQIVRLRKIGKLHPEAALRLRDLDRTRLLHEGRIDEAHAALVAGGIVDGWLVVGPFDNEDRKGHSRDMEPEADLDRPFDTGLAFQGDERPVSWREVRSQRTTGTLNLGNFLYPASKVCGYAGTYVELGKAQEVAVWAASGGTLRLWVDQALAIDDDVYRAPGLDRHAASVKLGKGTHRILAKTCVDSGAWTLVVRLTDRKGRPLAGAATLDPAKPYAAKGAPPKVGTIDHAFAAFMRELEQHPEDPAALSGLARYMYLTRSDDLTETVAGDHAGKAADMTGSCEDLLLVANTTDDPHIGLNALRKCILAEPDNPEAAYLHALGVRGGMGDADFQNLVRDLVERFPADLHVQLLGLQQLENIGMSLTAYRKLVDMRERFGEVPALLRASEYLADGVMSAAEARDWKEHILAIRADDDGVRRDLLELALGRGDEKDVLVHLDAILAADPDGLSLLRYAASTYMAMGEREEAEKALVQATVVSPQNPTPWQRLGQFYALTDRDDLALSCYQTVLELNPSNVDVREYLAHLYPKSKFEKEFIVGRDEILDMDMALEKEGGNPPPPRDIEGYDATMLVDQEVNRVYGNGMASTFVQRAVRINTEQGEKMFRYVPVTFSPSSQDLDVIGARVYRTDGTVVDAAGTFAIPIFDEDVRIYYDMVQEIIEMPPLHRGDIVDVRYKISDSAPRNMWERHYGNVVVVQGQLPTTLFRYGLIAPADLDVRVQVDAGAGLSETSQNREPGGQDREATVLRLFERTDIPAIEAEPRMPPIAEVSPQIKVSTFGSWEEFGTWWWGLSSQAMVADKTIKDRVETLVSGKHTEAEKVEAIFDWVIRSTRYIALEFGVHGYKPYPSPLVVSRGFGDCKDKATLLYVMLREAGVAGSLALVRTRNSGEIGSGFPFQFQFDHAIAYVPSMNRFLDGTVDYVGTADLPPGDQDVFALVVDEGGTRTMRTPRLAPDLNRQDVAMTFHLEPDGDASIEGEVAVKGMAKAYYRSTYQSEGTRDERLEDELSTIFPGLKLESQSFEGLDGYAGDVKVEFTARIPNYALVHEGDLQFAVLPSHNLLKSFASLSKRRYDVVVGNPRTYVDAYTYAAPPGWAFADVPPDIVIGKPGDPYWFSFTTKLESPSRLVLTAVLGFDAFRVEVKDYDRFREFCRQVDDAMGQRAHTGMVTP